MAENSKIEWCDHTFNPWVGCTKLSPACDHCYAEGWAKRTGQAAVWSGERRRTSVANWNLPLKWNKQAEKEGRRYRVFCASLADVFDNQVPEEWRIDLWTMIATTKNLDWLLLTKRPQNIAKMLPDHRVGAQPWNEGWPNVWLGTTVENQQQADLRIPHLHSVPARIRFISYEPALGALDLTRVTIAAKKAGGRLAAITMDALRGRYNESGLPYHENWNIDGPAPIDGPRRIDWVICGGESGPGARPMHPDWARSLRDQCAAGGVPFLFKQWGEWLPGEANDGQFDEKPMHSFRRCDNHEYEWPRSTQTQNFGTHPDRFSGTLTVKRVGKKAAGHLLDGREHNDFPKMEPRHD